MAAKKTTRRSSSPARAPEAKQPEAKQPEAKQPEAKQPEAKQPEARVATGAAPAPRSRLGVWLALAVLLVVGGVWVGRALPGASTGASASASASGVPVLDLDEAERNLLAPLGVGSRIRDYEITFIESAAKTGALRIVLRKGEASVMLDVNLTAEGTPLPPVTAGPYSIYYTHLEKTDSVEAVVIAEELAKTLEAHAGAAKPPRMRAATKGI